MASAAELALELLFLTRRLAKDESDDGDTVSLWLDATTGATPTGPTPTGPTRSPRRSTSAAAMDEIGRDVMEGASPRTALQELMRRGMRGPARARRADPRGLAAAQQAAAGEPARRHAAGGPRAAGSGRWTPSATRWAARTPTTPGSARCSSTRCRPTPAARSASWTTTTGSPPTPARRTRRSATCSAGRCSTSASPGMKQAMENATPEDVERHPRDARRPQLAARRTTPRGRTPPQQFERVHGSSTASSSRRTRRTPRS